MSRVEQALRARLDFAQAATKKFDAIAAREHEGRMHDTMQAWGAQRTGRWAGRGLQVQNLKRTPKGSEELADQLSADPGWFAAWFALEDLGGLVRTAITAPEGKLLVAADLSSIESRVLGWLTGCRWINQQFFEGRDTYKAFAEMWLGVPYEQVTKNQRTLAKPPFLGFGYGIGAKGLKTYASSMGVEMSEADCHSAIWKARNQCPEVTDYWGLIQGAFRHCAATGEPLEIPHLRLEREGRFLTIRLPSGRKLYYDAPEYDDVLDQCSYLGWDQYSNRWERIITWGGKLIENAVQAIARDILLHGMLMYTEAGGNIVFHVHDEAVAEEDEDRAEAALAFLNQCLSVTPMWASGLLLEAEGYVARRYRKD